MSRWVTRIVWAVLAAVVVTGAVILAVPGILRAHIPNNETAAIGFLKRLSVAEEDFKAARILDRDGDGTGEYGYLQQVAETEFFEDAIAGSARHNGGTAIVEGYRFRVFLPVEDGSGRAEASPLPSPGPADANNRETNWVCYAWPDRLNVSGNRAWVINQEGLNYQCSNASNRWDGDHGPETGAEAFSKEGDMTGPIDVGGTGTGGDTWTPA